MLMDKETVAQIHTPILSQCDSTSHMGRAGQDWTWALASVWGAWATEGPYPDVTL